MVFVGSDYELKDDVYSREKIKKKDECPQNLAKMSTATQRIPSIKPITFSTQLAYNAKVDLVINQRCYDRLMTPFTKLNTEDWDYLRRKPFCVAHALEFKEQAASGNGFLILKGAKSITKNPGPAELYTDKRRFKQLMLELVEGDEKCW